MRVLILHFRSAPAPGWKSARPFERGEDDSAGTDGVSLEMKKRRAMLESMGHQVAICSAYEWAEFPVPALEFDSAETRKMMRGLFEQLDEFSDDDELREAFEATSSELERELGAVLTRFSPDLLYVHNVLCLPIHPAATVALARLLEETGLPCTAIHHDILSEGAYKFRPTCDFAESLLSFFPPELPNLVHWTINSRNKQALAARGVEAEIIHDTMDFDHVLEPAERARIRTELRRRHGIAPGDVVLFVGARIVPNKQTEVAGHLTAALHASRGDLIGRPLYNEEIFSEESRFVLLVAGRPEAAFVDYKEKLFRSFDDLKISWIYAGDDVRPFRSEAEGFYALYPDMYAVADFMLYPTGWEGFGNQLLEAFAAGLPTAVFEYPVFKEDIGPKGARVVSLGDTAETRPDGLVEIPGATLDRAAQEILSLLASAEAYREMANNNMDLGRRHFGFDVLRAHLEAGLDWARSAPR